MAREKKLFKDWFDEHAVSALEEQFSRAYPSFDGELFRRSATQGLEKLEFSERVKQMSEALAMTLPSDRKKALAVLVRSLPECLPGEEETTNGFLHWPLGQFIADHCVDHFEESFEAMVALTQRFSAEFAVRPFAERYPARTFERLLQLTTHPSPHVRRWCSEGVRPRLPWGGHLKHLIEDPAPLWSILEALKDDPSLFVRRSVANNLNDISKDHPNLVVGRCRAWIKDASKEREWVVKHGLRSLVKDGHPGALQILGYLPPENLKATLKCSSAVRVGESLELSADLSSSHQKRQNLVVDFILHYVRSKSQTSGKVFKWKTLVVEPGQTVELQKRHSMRKTTIRKLYPGNHKVELQVNGEVLASAEFELLS